MKKETLTCVVCPMGCQITVEHEGNEIISVDGYTCVRGKNYAAGELTNPVRTLTSTIAVIKNDGTAVRIPVKSSKPIPKAELFGVMEKIHSTKIKERKIEVGDVLIPGISEGADIIACGEIL